MTEKENSEKFQCCGKLAAKLFIKLKMCKSYQVRELLSHLNDLKPKRDLFVCFDLSLWKSFEQIYMPLIFHSSALFFCFLADFCSISLDSAEFSPHLPEICRVISSLAGISYGKSFFKLNQVLLRELILSLKHFRMICRFLLEKLD